MGSVSAPLLSRAWAHVRAVHALPTTFVLVITALFALAASRGQPPADKFALILLAMLGSQVSIGMGNEWIDREADARVKPSKPIPSGLVRAEVAFTIVWLALAVMVLASLPLGFPALALIALGTGAGHLYNLWLKDTVWSWLPYWTAFPLIPIWVWTALDRFDTGLLWLYPLGLPLAVGLHLANALPDVAHDRLTGRRGLTTVLGERGSLLACWACFALTPLLAGLTVPPDALPRYLPAAAVSLASVLVAIVFYLRRRDALAVRWQFRLLCPAGGLAALGWLVAVMG